MSRRARIAMVLLAATSVLVAATLAEAEWAASLTAAAARGEAVQPGDFTLVQQLVLATILGELVLMVATPIAFLRWLYAAHLRARELGAGHRLGFSARQAITAWFIPVVSLVRPMRVMRGLAAASDPTDLSPATLEREIASPGYRDPARVVEQPVGSNPAVPVAAWWALWLITGVSSLPLYWRVFIAGTPSGLAIQRMVLLATLAAALLAIVVVRNIDIRMRERARRWDARAPEDKEDDEVERRASRRPRKRSRRRRADASTT